MRGQCNLFPSKVILEDPTVTRGQHGSGIQRERPQVFIELKQVAE